jgi:uncharacterized spore protein YtfJ
MDTRTRTAPPDAAPAPGTADGAPAPAAPPSLAEVEEVVARLGREIGRGASAEAVFGPPRTVGGRTIIPVARVAYGFGGGAAPGRRRRAARGAGQGPDPAASGPPESAAPAGAGGAPADGLPPGFGGGGGGRAEPVAVIELGPGGVRVVPVVDVNRLVGRVFAFGFGLAAVALVVRGLASRGRPAPPRAARPRPRLAWVGPAALGLRLLPTLAWVGPAALGLRLLRGR